MPVRDDAERLKHDLGKYVCFAARWLPEDAPAEELRTSLVDDLRRTRRSPAGEEGVAQIWAQLGPPLRSVPGFEALDADIAALVARAAQLDGASLQELRETSEHARSVADHIRRFVKGA